LVPRALEASEIKGGATTHDGGVHWWLFDAAQGEQVEGSSEPAV